MHPLFRRRLRPIAVAVLVFFSWSSLEPWNYALAAQAPPTPQVRQSSPSQQKAQTAPEVFESNLRAIKEQVRAARDGEAYQAQLSGLLKSLDQAVGQSGRELESTRQAVDRLARVIEHGTPSQEALKALQTQQQAVKTTVGQVRLTASGIEGLLRDMVLPIGLTQGQKQAKEAIADLSKEFEAKLAAIVQRAEQQKKFDSQEHQAFLAASVELAKGIEALQERVDALAKEATPERRRAQLWEQAFSKRESLLTADRGIRNEFDQTEAFLGEKNLPQEILDRHEKAVADYETNFNQLRGYLAEVDQAHRAYQSATRRGNEGAVQAAEQELESTLSTLDAFLKDNVKDPPHQPLDPNNLPHRTPKPQERKPRLKKEDFAEFQAPIRLAYNGDPANLVLAQATPDLPTPDDLAETIEVQFTPEVQALAAQLEHNPVKIYNWVRNNIDFVPTYGSIQGAHLCLLTKQCNDMDTASLLIALLRTSGMAARYVIGAIEVPIEQVMNWVGGFTDDRAALNFMASGGTPVTGLVSGGKAAAARMEHAWVEVYADYIPSRGTVHREGDTWIALDGSFKQITQKAGLDVQQITGFDPNDFFNQLVSAATIDPITGYITNLPATDIQTQIENNKNALRNYLATTLPEGTIGDIIGSKTIVTKTGSRLPATLPYRVVVVGSRFSTVADQLRHKIELLLLSPRDSTESVKASFPTAQLAAKRLTLSYMPASTADSQAIDVAGGYYKVSPYLVQLKPVLYIDGGVAASGQTIGMGVDHEVQITFSSPTGSRDAVTHNIPAATFAALGLDLQRVPADLIAQRKTNLEAAKNGLGNTHVPLDDVVGETLNLHALGYLQQVEGMNRIIATGRLAYLKHPSEMLVTLRPSISTILGVPFSVGNLSMNVDVKRYVISPVGLGGNSDDARAFMMSTGSWASAMEHSIFEQTRNLHSQGVSAVKILSIANQQGIPLLRVDSANISTSMPQLQIAEEAKTDIQNLVHAGRVVLVPAQTIQYFDWRGEGYLALDPTTGAGGYLISGGLAGGGTAQSNDPVGEACDTILTALSFVVDSISGYIDLSKFQERVVARGVFEGLNNVFGKFLVIVSAIGETFEMYDKTNCAWKTGAAAGLDVLLSGLAGMSMGYLIWLIIAATAVSALIVAAVVVMFIGFLAVLISSFLQDLIEMIPYCRNILRRMLFAGGGGRGLDFNIPIRV